MGLKKMTALALVVLLLALAWTQTSKDGPLPELAVLAREGAASPDGVVDQVDEFFRAQEIDFDFLLSDPLIDTEQGLAPVLVDFEDSARPCEALRDSFELDEDAITIIMGGTMRAPIFTARLNGLACGGFSNDCDTWERPALVALDVDNTDTGFIPVALAHELGHLFGLRHQGDEACDGSGETAGRSSLMKQGDMASLLGADLTNLELHPDEVAILRKSAAS